MDKSPRLQPGSQVYCPHCRRWHDVIAVHTTGTDYTIQMRYWECRGQRSYAGQEGGESRHAVRERDGYNPARMNIASSRMLVPLSVGCAGGAIGLSLMWWAQGRDVDNVGPLVAAVSTAVAVVGWYKSTQLQASAQVQLLNMQLLNEARRFLTPVLHMEQPRMRACSVPMHVLLYSDPVTQEQRTRLADTLTASIQTRLRN